MSRPIIPQFYPRRAFLWKGTLLWRIVPTDIVVNMAIAFLVVNIAGGRTRAWEPFLGAADRVWAITTGLVAFTLSFFLSQAHSLWRSVYSACRGVQCSLNTIGVMCATAAERSDDGQYTPDAEEFLVQLTRLLTLFHVLLYARVTTRFSPLSTPRGLRTLGRYGVITEEEVELLLEASAGYNAVLGWVLLLINSGFSDGRLCGRGSALPLPLANGLREEVSHLRQSYVAIGAALSGRAPSAYVQLVQVMTDVLVMLTPFALMHSVGGIGAVLGTALTTLFYSSILVLAKMLLDPFDNDRYGGGGGISINVATLLQETNVDLERWRRGAARMPSVTKRRSSTRE